MLRRLQQRDERDDGQGQGQGRAGQRLEVVEEQEAADTRQAAWESCLRVRPAAVDGGRFRTRCDRN